MAPAQAAVFASLLFVAPLQSFANPIVVDEKGHSIDVDYPSFPYIEKERLLIREDDRPRGEESFAVSAEYEFRNRDQRDGTHEVAFPVPEYGHEFDRRTAGRLRVWVDEREIAPKKEVRALVNGLDRTGYLIGSGIDVERHRSFEWHRLSPSDQRRLVEQGLMSPPPDVRPLWTVEVQWHWTQTFPGGKTIPVRVEYRPAVASQAGPDMRRFLEQLRDACVTPALERALEAAGREAARRNGRGQPWFVGHSIEYAFGSAGRWSRAIGNFELVVRRPADHFVTFCWTGGVEEVDATTHRARVKNFDPWKNLTVHFLSVR